MDVSDSFLKSHYDCRGSPEHFPYLINTLQLSSPLFSLVEAFPRSILFAMKTCFADSLEVSYDDTLPITDSRLKSDGIITFLKENAT